MNKMINTKKFPCKEPLDLFLREEDGVLHFQLENFVSHIRNCPVCLSFAYAALITHEDD